MENPEVKERLLEFIRTMGLSVAQFERRAGLSNGYIRNFRGSFGGNKFDLILEAFPMLNREWVTTGRGEMMLPRQVTQEVAEDISDEENENLVLEVADNEDAHDDRSDGKHIVFKVSRDDLEAAARSASRVLTDWEGLYRSSQREVETMKMLLDVLKEQLNSYKEQLNDAHSEIKSLKAKIDSK